MNERHYIGTGEKNCFFTLRYTFDETRQTRSEDGKPETYIVTLDYHLRNLSTNRDEAIAKAREITGKGLSANFEVVDIYRRTEIDWSVLQAGKYEGKSIHEVREMDKGTEYLCWLAENMTNSKRYAPTVALLSSLLASELGERKDARDEAASAKAAAAAKRAEELAPIANILSGLSGGFCASLAKDMSYGIEPRGRAISIVLDIYAKAFGRRNSKAYSAAYEKASEILTQEAA